MKVPFSEEMRNEMVHISWGHIDYSDYV